MAASRSRRVASSDVEVRVTSRGSGSDQKEAEQDLAKVAVSITSVGDRVTITARRTDQPVSLGDSGADVEVSVPPASSLQLRTSNGRIEAANTSGSHPGAHIQRRHHHPRRPGPGPGHVQRPGVRQPGPGQAAGPDQQRGPGHQSPPRMPRSRAETSNATLTFSGSLAPGANSFETSNGNLTLSTARAMQRSPSTGRTSNGRVQTDFPRLEVSDTAIRGHGRHLVGDGHPGDDQQR